MAQRAQLIWAQVTAQITSEYGYLCSWRRGMHSRRQLTLLAVATVTTLVLFSTWHNQQHVGRFMSDTLGLSLGYDEWPLCRQLPGAEDVVVVMKTGANEVADKLAVHLRTSLTCYPHHVIFSDYEEDLDTGQHLFDAFTYTSQSIKAKHRDFALYRKLQAEGRAGLLPSELSGNNSREKDESIRKEIPGWQLDKWKFLPMVNQTLHMYPDKHWYMFVEADTYLFWSNLLRYLAVRSWTDDHYVGSRVVVENLDFAHGGSGFLLSRPALEKVVEVFNDHKVRWENYNGRYWVGDHVLAAALREAGVLLQDDNPAWQGSPIASLDFGSEGGLGCSIAMTSHHQSPSEIEELWKFEQAMISKRARSRDKERIGLIRYRDVLEQYVMPRVRQPRSAWDNNADYSWNSEVESLLECEALCETDASCMQYALHDDGNCTITSEVILGEASEGVESGWMHERIQESFDEWEGC